MSEELRLPHWSHVASALAVGVLTGLLVSLSVSVQRKMRVAKGLAPVPGPRGMFLLGILPEIVANMPRFYDFQARRPLIGCEDLMKQYGGRMKLPWNLLYENSLYIASAEDVKHIMSTNFDNYIKPPAMVDAFRDLYEDSLFFVNHAHTRDEGEKWRVLRKLTAKVFATSNFKLFFEQIFHKYAMEMVAEIEIQSGVVNLLDVASEFTLRSIFDIGCGVPLREIEDPMSFAKALDGVNQQCMLRLMLKRHYRYFWWCMPSEYEMKRNVKIVGDIVDAIVSQRLSESHEEITKRSDSLSLFIVKAHELDESEKSWMVDRTTMRSVPMTFLIAGRDTTSSTISYAFYEIVRHSEVQRKIIEELQQLDKAVFDYDDMRKLTYIDAVVNETLRLHPAVPFDLKVAVEDDHLPDGTFVPAGTEVNFCPWYMGRNNAKLWGDDPLVFRPERWLEMKTRPSAYENPVFQAGPRICIGMSMALLEAKMFIAVLLNHFHVELQEGEKSERGYILSASLTLEGGLPVKMTSREARSF